MEPALFFHILGAMVVVGSLVLALAALPSGVGGSGAALRLGFRAIVFGALPGWIVMRAAAQWVATEQGFTGDVDPTWISIGYAVAEPALLLLAGAGIASWLAVRRSGSGGGSRGTALTAAALVGITLVAFLVVIWAMTTKPT